MCSIRNIPLIAICEAHRRLIICFECLHLAFRCLGRALYVGAENLAAGGTKYTILTLKITGCDDESWHETRKICKTFVQNHC